MRKFGVPGGMHCESIVRVSVMTRYSLASKQVNFGKFNKLKINNKKIKLILNYMSYSIFYYNINYLNGLRVLVSLTLSDT